MNGENSLRINSNPSHLKVRLQYKTKDFKTSLLYSILFIKKSYNCSANKEKFGADCNFSYAIILVQVVLLFCKCWSLFS